MEGDFPIHLTETQVVSGDGAVESSREDQCGLCFWWGWPKDEPCCCEREET